eukprot:gene56335-21414_t
MLRTPYMLCTLCGGCAALLRDGDDAGAGASRCAVNTTMCPAAQPQHASPPPPSLSPAPPPAPPPLAAVAPAAAAGAAPTTDVAAARAPANVRYITVRLAPGR